MWEAGVLAEIMLCRALMLVVALSAATLRTLVEQKTIRVMKMKTKLVDMPCHIS